jgi:enoyl-CoA hydratase/carnithine racemase
MALREFASELPDEVRVVVVRGEGASFSAGLDKALFTGEGLPGVPSLLEVLQASPEEAERTIGEFQEGFTWLGRPEIVSIAAVQGYAIGAGFQLALACDIRIAAVDAQFRMAETSLGLVPDLGGTRILRELVGYSRAVEICTTGRSVPADEAAGMGLVNAVVPGSELDAKVSEVVAALLEPPRAAVTETKTLLRDAGQRTPDEQLLAERQAQLRRLRDLAGLDG